MDMVVNVVGVIYGIALIMTIFVRTRVTELLRVDALFLRQPTESTRPINLIAGLLIAGYAIYSMLSR
ncbi:MAG: hypothetical protein A3F73_02060 [Gallionellales bacterium RIFCSPLOWO2_12_FULL_59_22]|nr:MAG: hypothetical protein A3H99_01330 [Gallionellales bacterium RIFCSPLOWO2_02_FULL_59_110]OGT03694.1 MAG: hypothetical protein A2Z65_12315 [Gallionellales bacterium RIFCSPLOWO2_02_58_13]OGT10827.1 MAG: hypothetical protein A3F73_02060 [Gallionellales bacterium RIFCSPLOWO2_12_FULL_59_22]